jgi:hypothetical protein
VLVKELVCIGLYCRFFIVVRGYPACNKQGFLLDEVFHFHIKGWIPINLYAFRLLKQLGAEVVFDGFKQIK